jgi:DNA-directed RNA polymerase subunit M/transcription elongation factor TFIIS
MKWTNERFIAESIARFGERFDYSLVDVKGKDKKVAIKCNECGTVFYQSPKGHITSLQGGCPTCRYKYVAKHESIPFSEFKKRATTKHGDKYIYDESSYIGMRGKVRIYCPIHGVFEQIAIAHAKGSECNLCGNDKIARTLTYDLNTVLDKFRNTHGDKYDYSLVKYVSASSKVKIICPEHGIFEQAPANHWKGEGCPICSHEHLYDYGKTSKGELKIKEFLLAKCIEFKHQYRIQNEDLFNPRTYMVVDFYIKSLKVIIEYNGEQHYKPVKFFGGNKKHKIQLERDIILRQYCERHKIKLIEIPYWDYDNIETILSKELKIHKKK